MEDKKITISEGKTDKEKVVLDIVSKNEFFYKFPNNINMVYTYPIMKIIETILNSEKKCDKNIGENIYDFFDYELNKENPIQKSVFIRIWDNIEGQKKWEDFVDLFYETENEEWNYLNKKINF